MIMSLKMALRSIGSNKLRAVLTMLGIIIGVMALVVLVSLVNGATQSVTDRMASLGSNYVQAYVWGGRGKEPLTLEELNDWAQNEPLIEEVAPQSANGALAKYAGLLGAVTVLCIVGVLMVAVRLISTKD